MQVVVIVVVQFALLSIENGILYNSFGYFCLDLCKQVMSMILPDFCVYLWVCPSCDEVLRHWERKEVHPKWEQGK